MKLKSIATLGFKSFADRIKIQFSDGITGVIGPNGSGKSNVIDAVRWVMGEQGAKHLRADNPLDIIFAGSQNRKPLSLAEVSLTFENDGTGCPPEYMHLSEVSIGRRIYRNGEREYFINKEQCRLKDVVELLMSIGLGSRSYSIIEQEKRDRIIQANPQDMREIIEEAAGISAFKQHRKDYEKRLESTNEKMNSLGEIEKELQTQHSSLKEQVAKAEQKKRITEELRSKEVTLIQSHVGFYRGQSARIKGEISAQLQHVQKSEVASAEWEAEANRLKADQFEITTRIEELENQRDDKRLRLTKLEERTSVHDRHNAERRERKEKMSQELSEERQNLEREETRLRDFTTDLEASDQQIRCIDGVVEEFKGQLEDFDGDLQGERVRGEEIRSEIRALDDMIATLAAHTQNILQQTDKSNKNLKGNESGIAECKEKMLRVQADKKDIETQLSSMSKGMDGVVLEKAKLEVEIQDIEAKLKDLRDQRDHSKQEFMTANSHCQSLRKLLAANEGLSSGAKCLKEQLQKHVKGFFFEQVRVHADDEVLFEKAFPEYLQAAIVENQDNYVDLIDKAEELGITRVTLILKDIIPALSKEEKTLIGKLSESRGVRNVGCRAQQCATPELQALLNRIFIVRDEWTALKAFQDFGSQPEFEKLVFVSERGTVFNHSGKTAFGEAENGEGSGLLQRKRELEDLEKKLAQSQGQLAESEGKVYELEQRFKELEGRRQEIQGKISAEEIEVVKITKSIESNDLQLRMLQENLSRLEAESQQYEKEILEYREQLSKHQEQMNKAGQEKSQLARELEDFELQLSERKERREELAMQLQNKRSERSVLQERQSNSKKSFEDLSLYIERAQQKIERTMAEIEALAVQMEDAQQGFTHMAHEIEVLRKEVKDIEVNLDEKVNGEAEIAENLRVVENKLKAQKDAFAAREKVISEKKIELARVETILDTAERDAWERFQLKAEDLPTSAEDNPQERQGLERSIKKLQEELSHLGSVNELALEEFNSVEERLQFLVLQRDDVIKSIEELSRAIAEIEENTKTRFKETLETVDREFQLLFPVLFPGGSARLSMLNPEDLLNTGVEIMVQLPGKRMQNMSLFSGGEKALTAISLIFALLKTKPAPFCLLDEVDAPLDEANVGRFNRVLEALSGQFQFVVITHNRRTMEILDTVYGISMPEPGVSKLVSVDMSEVPNHLKKEKPKPAATAAPSDETDVAEALAAAGPVEERPGATAQ